MEKLGIIDLGSNTARLVIAEMFTDGHYMVVNELKEISAEKELFASSLDIKNLLILCCILYHIQTRFANQKKVKTAISAGCYIVTRLLRPVQSFHGRLFRKRTPLRRPG